MPTIGIHASHEIYSPAELLRYMHSAADAGFTAGMCSDHFHPWSADRAESGFAWSWLGAALQATPLTYATVCAPGQRYHPAIIAQAAATLAEMFPDRFWLAVGTGQNLNEHITGDPWIAKSVRQKRLFECVDIMRRLWAGDEVSHEGLVKLDRARLYSRPERAPRLFGAAISAETAAWVGSWADGLITVAKEPEELAKVVTAFRNGGGQNKPMLLQAAVSIAETDEQASDAAMKRWGIGLLDLVSIQDLATPQNFDAEVATKDPRELINRLRISASIDQHIDWIKADFELGFAGVYLHYVGDNPHEFLKTFGTKVMPALS